jgi:hypothetical protein
MLDAAHDNDDRGQQFAADDGMMIAHLTSQISVSQSCRCDCGIMLMRWNSKPTISLNYSDMSSIEVVTPHESKYIWAP